MTKTNDTALSPKQMLVPPARISTPARAGPSTRASWKMALLRPIAFGRSAAGTSSETNDCRVGLSTANPSPYTNTST